MPLLEVFQKVKALGTIIRATVASGEPWPVLLAQGFLVQAKVALGTPVQYQHLSHGTGCPTSTSTGWKCTAGAVAGGLAALRDSAAPIDTLGRRTLRQTGVTRRDAPSQRNGKRGLA